MNKGENQGYKNALTKGQEIGFNFKYFKGLIFRTLLTNCFWNFGKLKKNKLFIMRQTQALT